jgi:hypothetical protein
MAIVESRKGETAGSRRYGERDVMIRSRGVARPPVPVSLGVRSRWLLIVWRCGSEVVKSGDRRARWSPNLQELSRSKETGSSETAGPRL